MYDIHVSPVWNPKSNWLDFMPVYSLFFNPTFLILVLHYTLSVIPKVKLSQSCICQKLSKSRNLPSCFQVYFIHIVTFMAGASEVKDKYLRMCNVFKKV